MYIEDGGSGALIILILAAIGIGNWLSGRFSDRTLAQIGITCFFIAPAAFWVLFIGYMLIS